MRKKILLSVLVMAAGLLLSVTNLSAQVLSEICDWEFTTTNGAPSIEAAVLFTWETLPNGIVQISIAPHPDNAETINDFAAFRGANGLATAGFSLSGELTFSNYFTKSLSADKKMVLLAPVGTIPQGTMINFSGMCEYKTTDDLPTGNGNDLYPNVTFPAYTYGTNCTGVYAQKLATPANVSVDASNVLTFTPVANATTYIVTVTINGAVIKTLNVSGSGETISAPVNGDASVIVAASDDTGAYANSDASEPASWTINNPDQTDLGSSTYCERNADTGGSIISIETDASGDILITLHNGGWRAGGVQLAGFTVQGISGTLLLDKISAATANPQVFSPKAGITIPKGTLISYNGTVEYQNLTLPATGTYITGQFFTDYVYGTACTAPQLDPPTNLVLGTGNILTFTPDANAARTEVYVMMGSAILQTTADFSSGDAINFPVNGSFTINARSMTGSTDYQNSDLSASVALDVALADQPVSGSTYCEADIAGGGGSTVNISLETAVNGDIVVTINGTDNTWRNGGIHNDGWLVGGVSGVGILDKIGAGTDNPQIFRPKAGITIPKGTLISFTNGTWEWAPNNGYINAGTPIADYVYGSACSITGLCNIQKQAFSVYSPAKGILYINGLDTPVEVKIFDMLGKVVDTQISNGEVSVANLSNGIYLLSVEGQIVKFVK